MDKVHLYDHFVVVKDIWYNIERGVTIINSQLTQDLLTLEQKKQVINSLEKDQNGNILPNQCIKRDRVPEVPAVYNVENEEESILEDINKFLKDCETPKIPGLPCSVIVDNDMNVYAISPGRNNVLGKGSSGIVKLAQNINTNERVAVKIFCSKQEGYLNYYHDSLEKAFEYVKAGNSYKWTSALLNVFLFNDEEPESYYKEEQDRVNREILFSQRSGFNTVKSTATLGNRGRYRCEKKDYIFQPLGECNLTAYLCNKQPLAKERFDIAIKLAEQLVALHEKNIAHLDIKGGNIIKMGDVFKFIDFDISEEIKSYEQVVDIDFTGNELYMAPETYADNPTASLKTDVYGLGYVVFNRMKLDKYYSYSSVEHLDLYELRDKMCNDIPENRPTAQEVLDELKSIYSNKYGNGISPGSPRI